MYSSEETSTGLMSTIIKVKLRYLNSRNDS